MGADFWFPANTLSNTVGSIYIINYVKVAHGDRDMNTNIHMHVATYTKSYHSQQGEGRINVQESYLIRHGSVEAPK